MIVVAPRIKSNRQMMLTCSDRYSESLTLRSYAYHQERLT
jgi:hypothetical protein